MIEAALALYGDLPFSVRLHTRIRALTCPLEAVAAHLPAGGDLLDVGCGHGLFSNLAVLRNPALRVLGVDPSAAKIQAAAATTGGRVHVAFREGLLESVTERSFDVLSVLDVLYLVSRTNWPRFLAACLERLRPGGRLLLKEVDVRPRWKFYRCLLQETLSVRLLGITFGREFAFAPRDEMVAVVRQAGFADVRVTDLGGGYLTPHVLYEATRP